MEFGQNGLKLLTADEGLRLTTYDDATGKAVGFGDDHTGVLTIGYGHTGPEATPGRVITTEGAVQLLQSDLAPRVAAVNHLLIGCAVNQNQFDALVCFAFNVGYGANGLGGSTLLKKVKAGDFGTYVEGADGVVHSTGAAAEFARWNKAGGAVMKGLIKRRADEAKLFVTPA